MNGIMKAIVWTNYGPPEVLQLQQVEKPSPKEKQVLIKICAATVTQGDCELRNLKLSLLYRVILRFYVGLGKPTRIRILGQELAGEIEALGSDVKSFRVGDQVFAPTGFQFGAYAEYICLPESNPIRKPTNMTYDEAATIPTGGINALHFIQRANVKSGEHVLLNGAGGSIGTYALQMAKNLGAKVTCVDSAEKLEMLRAVGADAVIDYAREDFTKRGETYDVIIDIVGKSSFSKSIHALKPNGRYVLGNPSFVGMMRGAWTNRTTDKRVIFDTANYQPEHFALLKQQIEAGKLKAVIDRRYPLEQTAEAHRYVDAGHKKGNVTITVEHT